MEEEAGRMGHHHVVIGNGVAGATAAETLAEHDPHADITVFTDEDRPLYNRIILKAYMKGELPVHASEVHDRSWYEERGIDLQLSTEVTAVATEAREVRTPDDAVSFDTLLVATGGSPRRHPADNDFSNVHYMWTYGDAKTIRENAADAEEAVVIGGGLLGIDLAVAFASHDVSTTYLIREENWWRQGLDTKGAELIHSRLRDMDVSVRTGVDEVTFETEDDRVVGVYADGARHDCDVVGVAIGQRPNSDFIDVEKNERGMIRVDERLSTSAPGVYAAGGMVEYESPLFGRPVVNGSWSHSAAMGETAANNMCGADEPFTHINTYGVGHFDVPFLALGEQHGSAVSRRYGDDAYRRLFFADDRLVGAVMIGETAGRTEIQELIRQGTVVEDPERLLERSYWR